VALSKQAGEQRDKGKADKGNAAARHATVSCPATLLMCDKEVIEV